MTKRISLLLFLVLMFAGCGQNNSTTNIVKENLESVQKKFSKRLLMDELIIKGDNETPLFYHEGRLFSGAVFDVYDNGKVRLEFEIKDGTISGLCKEWYENGQLSKEYFVKNGQGYGENKQWYANGQLGLRRIYNDEGNFNGLAESWYENGQLQEKANYLNGELNGEYIGMSSTGLLVRKGLYEKGLKVGFWEEHKSEQWAEGNYLDGKKNGKWLVYSNNGQLLTEEIYKNGTKSGVWAQYDEKGKKTLIEAGGNSYILEGRQALNKPRPEYQCDGEGTVVVKVYVDREGRPIKVIPGVDSENGIVKTTTTNECLWNNCRTAAMRTHWQGTSDTARVQIGYIIYKFKKG